MRPVHYRRGEGRSLLVLGDNDCHIDVGPRAQLECSFRDCRKQSAILVRTGWPSRWSTRCKEHQAAHEDG